MAKPKYQAGDLVEVQCTPGVSWQPGEIVRNASDGGLFIGRLWWVVQVGAFHERHTVAQRRIRARRTADQGKG
jgi:hypothetical protein